MFFGYNYKEENIDPPECTQPLSENPQQQHV